MRILVLYPGLFEERRKLLAPHRWRLRLSNTSLILADDRLHPGDAKVFGDVLKLPSPERAEEVWEVLARYLRRHPVDGILAQSETGLLIGARASREFGLPGPALQAVMATVNKFASRTQLAESGVLQPKFELVHDAMGVKLFGRQHGWPVVLKACASSRQRLVTCVMGEDQVDQAVQHMLAGLPLARDVSRMMSFAKLEGIDLGMDARREFLVEAFQEGLPLECDAMLDGGSGCWFGVCEQLPSPERRFFIEGYLLPARLDVSTRQGVLNAARSAVEALGLAHTGVSVEMRLGAEGASIIEVNGRLPWDEGMQEFFQAATGRLPGVLALKLAMGKRLPQLKQVRHAALVYRANYEAAQVQGLPDARQWKQLTKGARAAWLLCEQGQRLLHGDHPDSRPHIAGVLTTDRRSTQHALDMGQAMLGRLNINLKNSKVDHKWSSQEVHLSSASA